MPLDQAYVIQRTIDTFKAVKLSDSFASLGNVNVQSTLYRIYLKIYVNDMAKHSRILRVLNITHYFVRRKMGKREGERREREERG